MSNKRILIRGGDVVNADHYAAKTDVLIENGKIKYVSTFLLKYPQAFLGQIKEKNSQNGDKANNKNRRLSSFQIFL